MAARLGLGSFACPVITVAGTNGKGSCVAFLESMLAAQGYRCCSYTSPHLLRYNERVRIAGREVDDTQLCAAFAQVEFARGEVPLTYFEFGTLAALLLFWQADPQAIILEVGLGGRLDAVNLVDADVALITSIGLDHMDWLGNDRESIGREKAGVFRPGRVAVCGDLAPPDSIRETAKALGSDLYQLGVDYRFALVAGAGSWDWQGWDGSYTQLPLPSLGGALQLQNAASCIAVLQLLRHHLPVATEALVAGLRQASLSGRFQLLEDGPVPVILDVAHNAEACVVLATGLRAQACTGQTHAVLGMLKDKPAQAVAAIMDGEVHAWYLGGLETVARGQSAESLAQRMGSLTGQLSCHADVPAAFQAARRAARPGDRIIVFGSFHTVEAVLRIKHE